MTNETIALLCLSIGWNNKGGSVLLLILLVPSFILNIRAIKQLLAKNFHSEMIVILAGQVMTIIGRSLQLIIFLASVETCKSLYGTYVVERSGSVVSVCTLVILTAKNVYMATKRDPEGYDFRSSYMTCCCVLYVVVGVGLICLQFVVHSQYMILFHVVYHASLLVISALNCFQASHIQRKIRVYEQILPGGNIFAFKVDTTLIGKVACLMVCFEMYYLVLQCLFIECVDENRSTYCNTGKWMRLIYYILFLLLPTFLTVKVRGGNLN